MSGRTAGRYGGASDDYGGGSNSGASAARDEVERRRESRYDRRRSRSTSPERHGRGSGGERYARIEPTNMYQGNVFHAPIPAMSGGMNPGQLLQFLQGGSPNSPPPLLQQPLQQQPQQQQQQPVYADVSSSQSVQDFIPTVPKSLLNLLRPSESSMNQQPHGGGGNGAGGVLADPTGGAQPINALALLEAPKIAPEVMRRARESRRAHISGFPSSTTEEELCRFFGELMPVVRRLKTQREVRQLGLAAGDPEDEIRQIPGNAHVEVDKLKNVQLRQAKSKAFAFIEVNMADLITEMIDECAKMPDRFVFQYGGRGYPITVRRPKDFEPLDGCEEGSVVMTGFHPSLPENKLRAAMEQFGQLNKFESMNGLAYAEFANAKDALDCRTELHGEVLGGKMVVVLPLFYWLMCVCHLEGIDVTVDDEDPISGKYALTHDLFGDGGIFSKGGGGQQQQQQEGHPHGNSGPGAGAVTALVPAGAAGGSVHAGALVVSSPGDALDPMKELLSMSTPLPEVLYRFSLLHPHLQTLYGNVRAPIFATRVLALLNLFDEEELILDETYSRLLADIEEEVEKYGRVAELIVPRREGRPRPPDIPRAEDFAESENPAEAFQAAQAEYQEAKKAFSIAIDKFMGRQIHPIYGGFGRVFVVYETVDEAAEAQRQIAGKLFGNRTVVTCFVFEDLLDEDLNGEDAKSAEGGKGDENSEEDGDPTAAHPSLEPSAEGGGEAVETSNQGEAVEDLD